MKKPGEVRPLQIAAKIAPAGKKPAAIEWSVLTHVNQEPEDDDLNHNDTQNPGVLKRIRGWIDRQIGAHHPETRMLRQLHRSEKLEIHLPNEADDALHAEMHGHLSAFWRAREMKHRRLSILTGIFLVPSMLLTIIPGPNVVGLGLTYLLYHHWRIMQGIRRVQAGTIEVELKQSSTMERGLLGSDPDADVIK